MLPVINLAVAERLPETYLPQPPDDQEKYKYFGSPRRWVFVWLLVASAGVLYGYIHVAERAWLICDDPSHAWVRATWDAQELDPRLPFYSDHRREGP